MLQQTQVKTVLPYFARWMAELPSFDVLAEATPDRVLKLFGKAWDTIPWARNLHKLSKEVAAMPDPPRTPQAWQELPGVGPYTRSRHL